MKRLFALAAPAIVLVSAGVSVPAAAQFEPAGAVSAHFAWSPEGIGGGAVADITAPLDVFRIGGSIGVAGISAPVDDPSSEDPDSRFLVPIAVALGVVVPFANDALWFDFRARAGVWTGATSQGFAVGAWVSTGAYLDFALGDTVAIGVGCDGWFALGHGDTFAVAPGVTLAWMPARE
jgi:hypothetical protein